MVKISNVQLVLSAIETPTTISEIQAITGLEPSQILTALKGMRERGCDMSCLGVGANKHYYLPKNLRPSKTILKEQELIDLVVDTEEWWTRKEILSILGINAIQFKNYIARLKYKGYIVKSEYYEARNTHYYISSNPEVLTEVEELEKFLTGQEYIPKPDIIAKFGFDEKEFRLRMGAVRRNRGNLDKRHSAGNKVSYRILPEVKQCAE